MRAISSSRRCSSIAIRRTTWTRTRRRRSPRRSTTRSAHGPRTVSCRQLARCAREYALPRGRERVLSALGVRATRRRAGRTSIRRPRSRRDSTAKRIRASPRRSTRRRRRSRRSRSSTSPRAGRFSRSGAPARASRSSPVACVEDAIRLIRADDALGNDPPRDERLVAGGAATPCDDGARRGDDPSRIRARRHVRDAAPARGLSLRRRSRIGARRRRAAARDEPAHPGASRRLRSDRGDRGARLSCRASCPREARS